MQKIIDQKLGGSEETAKLQAQYTWEKDEVAWYFCKTYRDVFKVQFTGKHWIVGNKWRYDKIYQYKYLESSNEHHNLVTKGLYNDGISHGSEDEFYTSKQEALTIGFRYIERVKKRAIEEFEKDSARLKGYEQKMDNIEI